MAIGTQRQKLAIQIITVAIFGGRPDTRLPEAGASLSESGNHGFRRRSQHGQQWQRSRTGVFPYYPRNVVAWMHPSPAGSRVVCLCRGAIYNPMASNGRQDQPACWRCV
jgi:hypothetical protein